MESWLVSHLHFQRRAQVVGVGEEGQVVLPVLAPRPAARALARPLAAVDVPFRELAPAVVARTGPSPLGPTSARFMIVAGLSRHREDLPNDGGRTGLARLEGRLRLGRNDVRFHGGDDLGVVGLNPGDRIHQVLVMRGLEVDVVEPLLQAEQAGVEPVHQRHYGVGRVGRRRVVEVDDEVIVVRFLGFRLGERVAEQGVERTAAAIVEFVVEFQGGSEVNEPTFEAARHGAMRIQEANHRRLSPLCLCMYDELSLI